MSKPYYADVVRHYARKAELFPKADGFFATVSPDAKCKACAAALNTLVPVERSTLVRVYAHPQGVHAGVLDISCEKMIPASAVWTALNKYERKVARLILIQEVPGCGK